MGFTKRLDDARKGYLKGDKSLSAAAHDPQRIAQAVQTAQEEHGGESSQYLGQMVYGGLDGIVTTFAVVSGVVGAELGSSIILIMGLANLLADGFSMAIGAYLSTKSEKEVYQREKTRESWEIDHFPEGERAELIEIYRQRGYEEEEVQQLVAIQTRKRDRWVQAMMIDELGMLEDESSPLKNALATLAAFILAGAVPLLIYLVGLFTPIASNTAFILAFVLSGAALFSLGAAKVLVTRLNPLRSGLEMLIVGGLAAGVAYVVGALLKGIGG